MNRAACTIVSNNYIAFARTLARSFLEHNPGGRIVTLIVDRPDDRLDYEAEPFEVLFAHELGIPAFASMAFRYSILELNTAVKPFLLEVLLKDRGLGPLCYFDPDILVMSELGELYSVLAERDAVLTPHITAPLADRKHPSERDILLSGIYNLGFLGLTASESSMELLRWWQRKLYRECLHRVEQGLFVDQRWMDLAPAFLPRVEVLRDPGYNVAYWNLLHRSVEESEDGWTVNGAPLRFFHFSGFDPAQPQAVSRHQDRFSLSDLPGVAPLFRRYAERLHQAGHRELKDFQYGYGRFDNGILIPPAARSTLGQMDPAGRRWEDPFVTRGDDSFYGWLQERIRIGPLRPPRIALCLRDQAEELQRHFPGDDTATLVRYLGWFAGKGAEERGLDEAFIEPVRRSLEALGYGEESGEEPVGDNLLEGILSGAVSWEHPVSAVSEAQLEWLAVDAGYEPQRRPVIPRLALLIHQRRPDLGRAFPDPLGDSRVCFGVWYATYGRLEYDLPRPLVRPVVRTLPPRARAHVWLWWVYRRLRARWKALGDRRPHVAETETEPVGPPVPTGAGVDESPAASSERPLPGVNVVGWPEARTGVGQACRATLEALEAAGVETSVWPLRPPAQAALDPVATGLPRGVTLFHVNADMMASARQEVKASLTAGRPQVAYWFWELSYFPLSFSGCFNGLDEVWAPTRFCQAAYETLAPIPVRWVPPCVIPPSAAAGRRADLGVPQDVFLFFNAFDLRSVAERKNPLGALKAFSRLVDQTERPVHLLLKISHPEFEPELVRTMREMASSLPVTVVAATVGRQELDAMSAMCDAYLSLHRSEGLGIPLIEAMYLGKPVIATGYGGVTDFLDESTGWVVHHALARLDESHAPYPRGAVWADPDLEHAAELMLRVLSEPEEARTRAREARRRVEETYAPEAAGARLALELERLQESPGTGHREPRSRSRRQPSPV